MREEAGRVLRFGLNGVTATAVHYAVLAALVEGAGTRPVALASGLAALCGIAVSYFGNRRFVLRAATPHRKAGPRFLACYAAVIGLHTGLMGIWADWAKLNYSAGFVLFIALAACVTYLSNRFYVFRGHAAESPSSADGSAAR